MLGYLKDLYEGAIAVLSSKGAVVYPLLAKTALVVLSGLLVWAIFKRVMSRVRKRGQEHEFICVHEQVFDLIQRAMLYAIVFVSGIMILNIFKLPILEQVFYAVLIILLAIPVRDFTLILLKYMQAAFVKKSKTKVDDILFELLNKFFGVIIFAIAIMLALDVLGINVMPFVAGAGVVGIAVGFAAKDTLSNLIAGILLIIDRPFEMGDRIEVWSAPKNSATWGDVIDIGLRATKIRTNR
jgi:small-conductance mechanosensitive channel